MTPVTKDGHEFNERLSAAFDLAFHDVNTKCTSDVFEDLMNESTMRAWEAFNAEFMIILRWAMSIRAEYEVPSESIGLETFSEVSPNKIYSAYYLNKDLPINLLLIRVSENDVIIVGKDFVSNQCAYGLVDLGNKKIKTNVGPHNLIETLGLQYGGLLFEYLSMSF